MSSAITLSPDWDAVCRARLGVARLTRMAFAGTDLRPLWHELMNKASDDASGAGMGMDLSAISQLLGDKPTGLAIQKEMLALWQVFASPCPAKPRLKVLALAGESDIGGNTPLEFLLEGSGIALATYYVVPGVATPVLPDHDVAIVVAEPGHPSLPAIESLLANWPRPVLNHPRRLAVLARDQLCRGLGGVAGLEIPETARVTRAALAGLAAEELALAQILADGRFPLIIRPLGSHAGFGLARLEDRGELAAYLGGRGESEFFLSRFVDYSSADGWFRKYRLVLIDGQAFPCHMAICEEWKAWYLNADMALSASNRQEEAAFMREFDCGFGLRHAAALGEVGRRIGLDYVTVDCAETKNGELLIFEADHTAIVHDMDPPSVYPYKPGQMSKIFQAAQAMFIRQAARARAA